MNFRMVALKIQAHRIRKTRPRERKEAARALCRALLATLER
jgi:hypothetical protein